MVTINQLRPIRVRFTVAQSELEGLRGERGRDVRVLVSADPADSSWSEGRLAFVDDKVQANTYPVNVVREDGTWKVCDFFSLSRNPDKPGLLSGFENW